VLLRLFYMSALQQPLLPCFKQHAERLLNVNAVAQVLAGSVGEAQAHVLVPVCDHLDKLRLAVGR
jgi:hypothetical protein